MAVTCSLFTESLAFWNHCFYLHVLHVQKVPGKLFMALKILIHSFGGFLLNFAGVVSILSKLSGECKAYTLVYVCVAGG